MLSGLTLTSDFGFRNPALAVVKAKLFGALPDVAVFDINHQIEPFNTQQAVYFFEQAYRHFPENTVHFVFYNLYENANKQLLYVYENRQHIFCPDNGFITMLFHERPLQLFRLNDQEIVHFNYQEVCDHYLHGYELISQEVKQGFTPITIQDILVKRPNQATYANNIIDAQVLFVDHYGNVVLNVKEDFFEVSGRNRPFRISFLKNEEINTLNKHYFDVEAGEVMAWFNTAGYLEIAVHMGSAAELFGFQAARERSLFYNQVKIFFE
ncbi:MAG: SAM-dependent chlorinase/fluorinase [Chitinophagaceae bacterium]|nr:SAM-dependent chlorinase/fluorinase [Chitinophagaceae bacterium]